MLELRCVTKRYTGIPVVSDVSLVAAAGEVTGYLGPNGSGRSTTLKMIPGLIEPSEGEILFDGVPVSRNRTAHKQRLGYVPEGPHLYPHLTGAEYLEMVGQLRGMAEGQAVVDLTGLTGSYEVAIDISAMDAMTAARASLTFLPSDPGAGARGGDGAPGSNLADPSGSTIFSAVEKLGLKLEPRKLPLGMLVVDRVEKTPAAN